MKYAFSFRYKLLLAFLLVSILPLSIVSILVMKEYNTSLEKNEIDTNLNFIKQAGSTTEQIMTRINEVSLFLMQNKEIYNFLHLPARVSVEKLDALTLEIYRTLMFFINNRTGIISIFIKGENGHSFTINPTNQNLDVLSPKMKRRVIQLDGDALWSTYTPNSSHIRREVIPETIVQTRLIKDQYNLDKTLGMVSLQIRASILLNILSPTSIKPERHFYILDSNKHVLYTSCNLSRELINTIAIQIDGITSPSGYRYISSKNDRLIMFYYYLPISGWTLVSTIPQEEIKFQDVVINEVSLVILVMIIINGIMAILFSRSFFTPLQTLTKAMKKLEEEQFDVIIPQKRNDEIGMLLKSFNNMARHLKELHEEIYMARLKEKEAELIALETQINPHFLYNTLDIIYWKSRMEGGKESAEMIKALAKLFRIVLSSGEEIIPLRKELEHLQYYIEIQKKHFNGRLIFNQKVITPINNRKVLKLILQPLVENAIIHGLKENQEKLHIEVSIWEDKDHTLFYEVKDNGSGFDPSKIKEILEEDSIRDIDGKRQGFGLKNVDERLRLTYGYQYGIQIESKPGEGTKITVRQPLINSNNYKKIRGQGEIQKRNA